MDSQATNRIKWLARIFLIWAILIVGRLIQLQVTQHEQYRKLALSQQEHVVDIAAPRGAILDRTGERLAMSVPCESVCVDPLRIPDLAVASDILAKILGLDPLKLYGLMRLHKDTGLGFMWIKRKVSEEEAARLKALKLDWIEFRPESKRVYAYGGLAAHVLGGVDFEQNGNGGIEQSLNEDLAGHAGTMRLTTDVRLRGYNSKPDIDATPGKDVKLTLLARLQYKAEQELKNAVIEHQGKWGALVAMDPNTGEILAMANYPTYNPNDRPKKGDDPARKNYAVMAPYEPGSVFKIITLSAAFETTSIRPETKINCGGGSINLFGRIIHDDHNFSFLSAEDVLAHSSNIGAINIGLKVGEANMYEYVRLFGFGKRTGLTLPGESPGMLRPLKRWQKTSIGSIAMGHEISVTTVQLAQAASVIANGGFLIQPKIVVDGKPVVRRQVLRPDNAILMRRMMEGVVLKPYGTGHRYARLRGYTSAGKTGTAKIYDVATHKYTMTYNASFVGFAPVSNPALVVAVTVSGSTGKAGYGGPTSAPVFKEVMAAGLRLLDVPNDLPDAVPDTNDGKADDNDLAIADLASSDPQPLAGEETPGQRPFFTKVADAPTEFGGPATPNFLGMSKREVVERSASDGVPVELKGIGLVHTQYPLPGQPLPIGQSVRIVLGR